MEDHDPEHGFDVLTTLTHRMRTVGFMIAAFTGMNVIAFLAGSFIRSRAEAQLGLLLTCTCGLAAIVQAFWFEVTRKRGQAYFEELSDELQWRMRYEEEMDMPRIARHRPPLRDRIVLREFLHGADLPLIPGRLGPAVYVVGNLVLPVGVIVLRMLWLGAERGGF